jgi:hypothetical protein
MMKRSRQAAAALPYRKSNPKEPVPHFEKPTQIKADYPVVTAIGGQKGKAGEDMPSCGGGGLKPDGAGLDKTGKFPLPGRVK